MSINITGNVAFYVRKTEIHHEPGLLHVQATFTLDVKSRNRLEILIEEIERNECLPTANASLQGFDVILYPRES